MSVSCPRCGAQGSRRDRACGACGAPLALLRWHILEQDQAQDGRLAVRRGDRQLQVGIVNDGVVPAGLVLTADAIAGLPGWVDRRRLITLQDQAITLEPGAEQQLAIPLLPEALERQFRNNDQPESALLELLTTVTQGGELGWTPRPLTLSLAIAREPWFAPSGSAWRAIDLEQARSGAFRHDLRLHNESAEALEIEAFALVDGPETELWGLPLEDRLLAEAFQVSSASEGRSLPAGASRELVVRFREDLLPETDRPRWFSLRLVCQWKGRRRGQIQAVLVGRVLRAPRLTSAAPRTLTHASLEGVQIHRLVLRNSGQLPLRILGVDVLRGEEPVPASATDWLHVQGLHPGQVLEPGQEHELTYELRPGDRPEDELASSWCARGLVVHHDGAGGGRLERTIDAQLGAVQVPAGVYLGIDFGTSNSLVYLFRPDTHARVALPLEVEGLEDEQLPSLMYYQGEPEQPFLFGSEADAAAGLNPANLVRSIKSVIARKPETSWDFLEQTADGRSQHRTFSSQQLLDLFITELRLRAERAVSHLSRAQLQDLHLGPKVRFREAIFSHPVEVSASMKQALHRAAHAAGLDAHLTELDDFLEEACVDEATAAVLAYVYARLDPSRQGQLGPLRPGERVLCVDMGGGTTDVAAVELRDLEGYASGTSERVTVVLHATAGDPRFGGDDLDRLLASWILTEVQRQATEEGRPILLEELERAAGYRSFADYLEGFRTRRRPLGRDDAGEQALALRIYNKAVEVLRQAESAKRRLSVEEHVELTLSGEGWPQRGREQAGAAPRTVRIERLRFESEVERQVGRRLKHLDQARAGAGWSWDEVTTLLFSGQGLRVPSIRSQLRSWVEQQRHVEASPLLVVEPGTPGFDPKRCVGMGAAIWGIRKDTDWIQLINRMEQVLPHALEVPGGLFRFRPLPGLERGTPLPTTVTHRFRGPRDSLELFRNGQLFLRFSFPTAQEVDVHATGPGEVHLVVHGQVVHGELLQ
jgi:molecular chaperone DnaK (HSP70)